MTAKTENISSLSSSSLWDRLGIIGSALCLIHCAMTPLLFGVFSVAGLSFIGNGHFHQFFALLLTTVALLAFLPGYRLHRNLLVLVTGALGVTLLMTAGFFLAHRLPHAVEIALTITGSLILVGTHIANWRLSREVTCCPEH